MGWDVSLAAEILGISRPIGIHEALGLGTSEAQGGMTGKLHIFYYLDIPF